jgi:hypothetical protein
LKSFDKAGSTTLRLEIASLFPILFGQAIEELTEGRSPSFLVNSTIIKPITPLPTEEV